MSLWCAAWNCGDDAGTAADHCTGTGGVSSIESVNTSPSAGGASCANGAARMALGRGVTCPLDLRRMKSETCLGRSEEHPSELQSLMRISYAVFCLHNKTTLSPHGF